MTRSATPKLAALVVVSGLFVFAGLAVGTTEVVVVATPLVLALTYGLVASVEPELAVEIELSEDRVGEGDRITLMLLLTSSHTLREVEVGIQLPAGMEVTTGDIRRTIAVVASTPAELKFELRAQRWGAYRLGLAAIRVHPPGNLVVYEQLFHEERSLKVYPSYDHMVRGPAPLDTQLYSGDYVSRAAGDGIEFSNVRPFTRGDSVRRVNWKVTSRRRELHVNLAHSERDADVVMFLDAFNDIDLGAETTLDLTVRGASAVARHHLRHNDRVGLVSFGGVMRWLTASMGRTHMYRIADFLLDVETTFSYAWKNIDRLPHGTLPPGALVIAFSPLVDARSLTALTDISARGFHTIVVNPLDEGLIPAGADAEARLAHRAWLLAREVTKSSLQAAGVGVVTWDGQAGIDAVLAALPRRGRRASGAHP